MSQLSAILRIVLGSCILGLVWRTWSQNREAIASGAPLHLFGNPVGAGSSTVMAGFAVAGMIGAVLVLLGVFGILRGNKS